MKNFILSFLLMLYLGSSFSQQRIVDSLITVIHTAKQKVTQVKALNSLSREFWLKSEFDTALHYAQKAIEIVNHTKEEVDFNSTDYKDLELEYATALSNIGIIYEYQGKYPHALKSHQAALKITTKLGVRKEQAACYHQIGLIYWDQGNYSQALENLLIALKIREEIADKRGIADSRNNIGRVYANQGNSEEALKNYLVALGITEELNDKSEYSWILNNIGLIYWNQGKYSAALNNYFKALKIKEEIGDKYGTAACYVNIGIIYDEQKNYPEALKNYFAGLKIMEEIGNIDGMAASYINIGTVNTSLKNFDEARKYLNDALLFSKKTGHKEWMKQSYGSLAQLDSTLGNWDKAYEYYKLYSEIKDSILNEESLKQIAEMQTKYETEKKELQIENLNKDNEIKSTEIKKQNSLKLAFASGFAFMLILAFLVFRSYNQKKKANLIITAQKQEVEKQKEMVDEKNKNLELAYKQIEVKNHEILDSIRYAKRIQEAILPPQKLVTSYLENSFILYKPKDIVAGDFYWMHPAGDSVLFASVDCTGHGVPGAFVSILGHNSLNRCVKEFGLTQPSQILDKLCELIDEAFSKSENDIKDGMDIAICSYHKTKNIIKYSGAGNSLYHIRNGILNEYKPDKQPIGKYAYRKPFTNHTLELQKNDSVYVFTDGYADQFGGPKGKKFKYSQFENLLISMQDKPMPEQKEILNNTIENWKGKMDQIDDICIIGVKV